MTAPTHASAPLVPSVSEPALLREDAGGIAVLTLNRPERRNSLSELMLAALSEAFSAIARDSSVLGGRSRRRTAPRSVPVMISRR